MEAIIVNIFLRVTAVKALCRIIGKRIGRSSVKKARCREREMAIFGAPPALHGISSRPFFIIAVAPMANGGKWGGGGASCVAASMRHGARRHRPISSARTEIAYFGHEARHAVVHRRAEA